MAILKLGLGKHNAISGTVSSVSLADGKFGAQYRVTFTSGDDLYLPKDGFERQVGRMNKLPNELDGETVTFWKKPMDGDATGTKGYLNIDLGNTAGNKVAQAVVGEDYVGRDLRSAGVPVKATTYEEIVEKYQRSLASAVSITSEATEALDMKFEPKDVIAVAATIFIEANKRGV